MIRPYLQLARQYADDVITGKIPACHYVRQACARFQSDLKKQNTDLFPYYLDEKAAVKACLFIEQLSFEDRPHELIHLAPWQIFIVVNMFGWLCLTGNRQGKTRFEYSFIEVPRGNGKSALLSPMCVYALCTFGPAAQVYCAATAMKQARTVFDSARSMVRRMSAKMRNHFGLRAMEHSILTGNGSVMRPLEASPTTTHGQRPAFQVIDEIHAFKNDELYKVLLTGLGKRPDCMLAVITTAGDDLASIGYKEHNKAANILNGIISDESTFAIIYTTDDGDDWEDEATWFKANPNLNVSIMIETLRREYNSAQGDASAEYTFRQLRLNEWLAGASAFFNMDLVGKCQDKTLSLEDFKGKQAWIGIDLGTTDDLSAISLVFREQGKVYVFNKCYLPEDTLNLRRNPSYPNWVKSGEIIATGGSITDYSVVENDIVEWCSMFNVHSITSDPYNAPYLITRLQDRLSSNITIQTLTQNKILLNAPVKELKRLTMSNSLRFNSDVFLWCASNSYATRPDTNENIKIVKDREDSPNKVDVIDATLCAMFEMMKTGEHRQSVYETRGLFEF